MTVCTGVIQFKVLTTLPITLSSFLLEWCYKFSKGYTINVSPDLSLLVFVPVC